MRAIASHDNGRPIKLLEHTRSNYAHDADVPGRVAFNDDEVSRRFEFGLNSLDDLLADGALDLLTLAVAGIELLRQRQSLSHIAGQQQPQGFFGRLQSTGRIKARRQLETDLIDAK